MMMTGILQTKFWRRLALNLLGLGIFAILIYWGGLDKLDHLVRPQWSYIGLAALAIAFMLFIFAWRWSLLATQIAGHRLASPFDFYFYNVSSLAMGQLVPQTASVFVLRSLALTKLGDISLPNSVLSVILDKLFDLFVVIMFLSPALLLVSHILDLQQASMFALIIAGCVSVIVFAKPRWWIISMAGLVKIGIMLTRHIPFLKRFVQLGSVNWEQIPSRTVTHTYALTLLGHCAVILRAWLIAQAVGLDVSILAIFIGIALAQASLFIAFTPGGLGIFESAWFIALSQANVEPEVITAFLVAHRVFQSLIIAGLWFLLYLIMLYRNTKTHPPTQPPEAID